MVKLPRERALGDFPRDADDFSHGVFENSEGLVQGLAVGAVDELGVNFFETVADAVVL